jgi:hypothetical protein
MGMMVKSSRAAAWIGFAGRVAEHIDNYTVPQYGDQGEDQVTQWSAEDCIKQAQKYLGRFGRQSRPGEEKLDLMKAAHYIQMAEEKLG